ncbi:MULTISPECIES: hydantoinase/oxoprolinase family protein [Mesorhizobium]|uniref:Hydantoinase A/oxoprolinase domain-containing protein n=1 Tax=Mesorhizobium denitrificans TaxID=2294114 RepID=A0A371XC31_9HYPH|nr:MULTISPECIES: hydantoinase/oxoprolinase family protein [Mesorhizobium]RFC66797.1 hypothetical protein DY251_14800 [Mesorhizobium denitrificans]
MKVQHTSIAGFDVGGAHLKFSRLDNGRVTHAETFATPLWRGLHLLTDAFAKAAPHCRDCSIAGVTMTGELTDAFPSRQAGVAALLEMVGQDVPVPDTRIYAGRSGFVSLADAPAHSTDIASANWHATAALVGKQTGNALFVDMGSTTTDIIATRNGSIANIGYTDSERLATGELVYTGFTRTFLFGVSPTAIVRGQVTPLMNEYFASIADVHRIMGVLDEDDDRHDTADGKEKTVAASTTRLARMVGRDADDLDARDWRSIAEWFSEQQLRTIHEAAFRVGSRLDDNAPIVGAGIGRWQIRRLADRLGRPFVDLADIIPASRAVRNEASNGAAATAVALLLG